MKMTKIAYVIVGVFVLGFFITVPTAMTQGTRTVFKYGIGGSPETIDPAQAWDSASIDIIDQVMEGLVAYDLFDPDMNIIPRLATNIGTWNADGLELTFALRKGITFHDGTKFNATAVKYSFDRLNHLIEGGISQIAELYEPLRQLHPTTPLVINSTEIVDEYTVTFHLNYQYVALMAILCFSGSYIVHPDIPYNRLIELNETLYGTGPYILKSCTTEETHFIAYENYWQPQPEIQEMIWILYDDAVVRQQALLAGDLDMVDGIIPDYLEEYEANPNLYVHPAVARTTIQCIGMNNKVINKTFRQAISYAIDYDYIIDTIMNGLAVRMVSPVPPGILYHDPTVVPANYNVTKARQILIDSGLGSGLKATDPDEDWYNLTDNDPIATFNYTYNEGNRIRGDIGSLITMNLRAVGIKILKYALSWPYLSWFPYYFSLDKLGLYMFGWAPDYNDPSDYINPLFSNTSASNSAQVNDSWLQTAMMDALTMTNETERREAYAVIQHYIVEDLMPWIFMFHPIYRLVHTTALRNFPRNVMGIVYFYPCGWSDGDGDECGPDAICIDNPPLSPFDLISGNVIFILLSLLGVAISLSLRIRKKSLRKCI